MKIYKKIDVTPKTALIVLLTTTLISCNNNNPHNVDSYQKLSDEVKQLQSEIKKINEKENQDTLKLETENLKRMIEDFTKSSAILTPDTKEFSSLTTDMGVLFIKIKDIEEYADGYKITFQIGNPSSIIYSHTQMNITYGRGNKEHTAIDIEKAKKYETTLTNDLLPSYWTNVEVILSPAKPRDIEFLWVSIKPTEVKLREPEDSMAKMGKIKNTS